MNEICEGCDVFPGKLTDTLFSDVSIIFRGNISRNFLVVSIRRGPKDRAEDASKASIPVLSYSYIVYSEARRAELRMWVH